MRTNCYTTYPLHSANTYIPLASQASQPAQRQDNIHSTLVPSQCAIFDFYPMPRVSAEHAASRPRLKRCYPTPRLAKPLSLPSRSQRNAPTLCKAAARGASTRVPPGLCGGSVQDRRKTQIPARCGRHLQQHTVNTCVY